MSAVGATIFFACVALLLFGAVLVFAAVVDSRRIRRIHQNAPDRVHQPPAARYRWLRRRSQGSGDHEI